MLRFVTRASAALVVLLLLPAAAFAQAAITGVVKDTSGAILPGVTVEAASPVLIEKVRSAVSDGTGQYRIVALPPGIYSVTFSLAGFSTVKRDGVELSGSFVATVNGDLKVGALEETITVTGETPIVDVQSAKVQQTVSKDILAAIPSSRMAASIQALIPGMTSTSDVGGSGGNFSGTAGAIHGGKSGDSRSFNDGLDTGYNGGSGGMFMANVGGSQEVVISTSGGLGEAETAGAVINVIPRDGGNTFTGSFFAAGANSSMQSSNFTQALKDQGVTAPNNIIKNFDINPMGGGRILRDKLWFYLTTRYLVADNTVSNMYFNKNAGNVNAWTYDPDLSRQAPSLQRWWTGTTRLTWQATPRNKINTYWDEQVKCFACPYGAAPTTAPEAFSRTHNTPSHVQQVTWNSPLTSRVLLEAGYGQFLMTYRASTAHDDGSFDPRLWNAVEQAGSIPGLSYRAPSSYSWGKTNTRTWRASASYVTGAHSMKFGYFGGFSSPDNRSFYYNPISSYRFNNGVANQLTEQGSYGATDYRNDRNLVPTAFYGQDQWTLGKLTLQGGVRYDHVITSYPEVSVGGNQLIPVLIDYPEGSVKGVKFNDVTPRMGAAYDLFGNGKTALKVTLGKYVIAQAGSGTLLDLNPATRLIVSTTRSWTDSNKNYVADCDLTNPAKNLECGAMSNQNFGKNTLNTSFDPDAINGWKHRPYNWELGTSVQHEIIPRVSVNVGYFRRWFGNFDVTDNRAVGVADYTPFTLTVTDPRLPGGASTITAYDVNPAKFGQVDNYVTLASKFGKQIEHWNGVDVTFNARLKSVAMQGGTSTGRTTLDNCAVTAQVPEVLFGQNNIGDADANVWASTSYCHQQSKFLTQVRGFGSYTVPRVNVQVSATFQSNPGPQQVANYVAPNAAVKSSLARDLSGNASSVSVNLVTPGTLYGTRLNQLDFRIAKVLRRGRTRTQLGFDLYNATNSAVPNTYNNTFVLGGSWLKLQDILTARFAKVSATFDF